MDFTGNVLGNSALIREECIGYRAVFGDCNPRYDATNVVTLQLYVLGNQSATPLPTNGLLFKIKFSVQSVGFSQLELFNVVLGNGINNTQVPETSSDGYFTNKLCGTVLCKPLLVDYTTAPNTPTVNSPVTFNASSTRTLNQGAQIVSYTWLWGDADSLVLKAPNSTTTHLYKIPNRYAVTLVAEDSVGVVSSRTKNIVVIFVYLDLRVGSIVAFPRDNVIAGTPIRITAQLLNNGTKTLESNVTISIEGNTTGLNPSPREHFQIKADGFPQIFNVTWDTSNLTPRVYRIDVFIDPVPKENNTINNLGSAYVQIIIPQPSSITSLGILQSTGIGILVLIGAGAAFLHFKKKPSWQTEPLTD